MAGKQRGTIEIVLGIKVIGPVDARHVISAGGDFEGAIGPGVICVCTAEILLDALKKVLGRNERIRLGVAADRRQETENGR